MSKIFGKPYAEAFVESLPANTRQSFADALNDNGDFLRVDLDLGPTALQETYEEDTCAKCALSFGGKELQGIICYTSETTYDFVSYEPQDEMRFWEIDAETCELTEILTHEKVTLGDLRLALGGGSGGGFDPADIPEGDILQNAVLGLNEDDELVKGDLYGKYVRIIQADEIPEPITQDFIDNYLRSGVFVNGTYKGFDSPVFLPIGNQPSGMAIGGVMVTNGTSAAEGGGLVEYHVSSAGIFSIPGDYLDLTNNSINLHGTIKVNNKAVPAYPSAAQQTGKSYHYVLDNGTIAWREGNGLYLHTVAFTVSGSSGNITLTILSDSATPIAFDADTGNIVCDGASFIQFANCGNFVFTRFGANGFNHAIYEFDTATGTFSNAITLATVDSDTVTPIG